MSPDSLNFLDRTGAVSDEVAVGPVDLRQHPVNSGSIDAGKPAPDQFLSARSAQAGFFRPHNTAYY